MVLGQGAWNSTSLSSQATKHLNLEEDGCLGNLGWWREMMPKQKTTPNPWKYSIIGVYIYINIEIYIMEKIQYDIYCTLLYYMKVFAVRPDY